MNIPIAIYLAQQLEDTHPTSDGIQLLMYNAANELRSQHYKIEELSRIVQVIHKEGAE